MFQIGPWSCRGSSWPQTPTRSYSRATNCHSTAGPRSSTLQPSCTGSERERPSAPTERWVLWFIRSWRRTTPRWQPVSLSNISPLLIQGSGNVLYIRQGVTSPRRSTLWWYRTTRCTARSWWPGRTRGSLCGVKQFLVSGLIYRVQMVAVPCTQVTLRHTRSTPVITTGTGRDWTRRSASLRVRSHAFWNSMPRLVLIERRHS